MANINPRNAASYGLIEVVDSPKKQPLVNWSKFQPLTSRKKPPPPAIRNLDLSDTGSENEFSRPIKAIMASRKNPAPIDLCSSDNGSELDFSRPSKAASRKNEAPVDLCSSDNGSKVGPTRPNRIRKLDQPKKVPLFFTPSAIYLDLSDTGSEDEFSRPSKAMASRKNPAPILIPLAHLIMVARLISLVRVRRRLRRTQLRLSFVHLAMIARLVPPGQI
jgi:hypothetical protein